MTLEKKRKAEARITQEWVAYLGVLFLLAMVYIYMAHRTDNLVREISKVKANLVELRAENITLKSEVMSIRSRENIEKRLESRGVKEPNRPIYQIEVKE